MAVTPNNYVKEGQLGNIFILNRLWTAKQYFLLTVLVWGIFKQPSTVSNAPVHFFGINFFYFLYEEDSQKYNYRDQRHMIAHLPPPSGPPNQPPTTPPTSLPTPHLTPPYPNHNPNAPMLMHCCRITLTVVELAY